MEIDVESSSAALSNFWFSLRRAFERAGNLFEETPTGLINHLPTQLLHHNFQNVQMYKTPVVFPAGTEAGKAWLDDHIYAFHTIRPFLQRYGCLPQDYETLCQQAIQDMQQPGFESRTVFYTICATNTSQTRVGPAQRETPS